ncbi:MAG: MCE family protein [Steroidobacteraceae bacterium]|nr:MCE family protein [Deltaproteobacteria bacterium]
MARKKSLYFVVGFFVTVGTIAAVALILWLGASKYLRKGVKYVTYFDESVQGLQVDSAVKYRGVEIGSVDKIRVAPDDRLIEVVIKADLRKGTESLLVSQLKSAGITGIVFVELDNRDPKKPDRSPRFTFKAEYPVIPSQQSDTARIFSEIDDVYKEIIKIDFEGISNGLKGTLKSVETTLSNPRINSILANSDSVLVGLDKTVQLTNMRLEDRKLDEILLETRGAVTDARKLIKSVKDELQALKLADTGVKVNRMVEGLEKKSRAISSELEATSENLRQTTDTLDQLLERVKTTPSDLLFSKPPLPRRKE